MMLHQLSGQDAQFLYAQSSTTLTHVSGISIYDPSTAAGGKVRFKDIIAHMESRLHVSPVFKRKLYRLPLDLDHPYWVEDENFDLESHIWHTRLPNPGDWRQLCILMARHHSRAMDMNRPLWDMMVIEGLDGVEHFAKGSYGIMTRVHHAAIDGASATHFFSAVSDRDAKGTPALKLKDRSNELGDLPTPNEVWNRAVSSTMSSPLKMANALMKFAPTIVSNAAKKWSENGEEESSSEIPTTRFNGAVTPHRMFDGVTFQLSELKEIKDRFEGTTINDVVIAIVGGALRKYLMKHKELPKRSLMGWCPVNARSQRGQEETPGNNISAMSVPIGSDIANPVERVKEITKHTKESKEAKSGLGARLMTDITKHIPGATMAGVARLMTNERFAPKLANVFISNVPGPQVPLFMNGAKCTHQYAQAPLSNGMTLFIATPSYNGAMSFNITTDRKVMPDIEFFRKCLQKSFEELRDSKIKKQGGTKRKSGSTKSRSGRKKKATGRKKAS